MTTNIVKLCSSSSRDELRKFNELIQTSWNQTLKEYAKTGRVTGSGMGRDEPDSDEHCRNFDTYTCYIKFYNSLA